MGMGVGVRVRVRVWNRKERGRVVKEGRSSVVKELHTRGQACELAKAC